MTVVGPVLSSDPDVFVPSASNGPAPLTISDGVTLRLQPIVLVADTITVSDLVAVNLPGAAMRPSVIDRITLSDAAVLLITLVAPAVANIKALSIVSRDVRSL